MHRAGILATVLWLCAADAALGQAWVKDTGGYYFKLSGSYLFATEEYNYRGDKQPIFADLSSRGDAWFRDVSFTAYLEYGLTDNVTLVGTVPFKILTTREIEDNGPGIPRREVKRTNGGLADLTMSLRYPLLRRPLAASVQGGVKLPLGYEKTPDNLGPPLGTGEIDFEARLFVGLSLWPFPGYFGGGIGYRLRGGPLHDEVPFSIEGGVTLSRFFAKVRVEGLQNTKEPPDLGSVDNNVIVGDQNVLKLMPTVSYRLGERVSLAGEIFHVLAGKNTTAGTTYQLALEFVR